MNKKQLWIIGWWETFPNREKYLQFIESFDINFKKTKWWKSWLADWLYDTYESKRIFMPDTFNADYEAWKIIFEKHIDEIDTNREIFLIWHSLGWIFLVKYLSENKFPMQIAVLHLVAPVWTYPNSELHNTATFSFDYKNLKKIPSQVWQIHIWASEDDDIVNYEDSEKYFENLEKSQLHTFKNRWHFLGSHFIELFETFL